MVLIDITEKHNYDWPGNNTHNDVKGEFNLLTQ